MRKYEHVHVLPKNPHHNSKKYRPISRYINNFHALQVPFNPNKKFETKELTPMFFFNYPRTKATSYLHNLMHHKLYVSLI